jgi:plastocyanin
MRKLALVLTTLLFVALAACASDTGDGSNTVATPPDDYGTDASPTASGAEATINDHGTKTFTDSPFEVEVEMDNEGGDFYFEPTFIKSPGGTTATVKLHNEGDIQHTFTIDDLDVDEELAPDEEKTITVDIGDETRYEFYCRFHQGSGMRGAFQPH